MPCISAINTFDRSGLVMSIQQIAGLYLTNCQTLGTALSPLVINQDGTVIVAAQRLGAAFDPATNMIGVSGIHVADHTYEMQLNFIAVGSGWQLSGNVIDSNGVKQACSGSREVGYESPTLANTFSCSDAFEEGDTVYISAAQGPGIVVDSKGRLQISPTGGKGIPFTSTNNVYAGEAGIGLLGNGVAPVRIAILGSDPTSFWCIYQGVVGPGTLPLALDFRLTDRGTVVIGYTNSYLPSAETTFWDTDSNGLIQPAKVNTLTAPIEFLIDITPVHHEELLRRWSIEADVELNACDMAKLGLLWHLTVGFFSAMGLGPYLRGGNPEPGLLKLLDSNAKVSTFLNQLWTLIKSDPSLHTNVAGLALMGAKLLEVIYEAGMLWKVMKYLITTAAWYLLFYLVAYILEVVFLPEAVIAQLLASFTVWSASLVQQATNAANACSGEIAPQMEPVWV